MNYTQILKRSWHILWHYPALWVFGILLAFAGGASGGSPSPQTGYQFSGNNNNNNQGFNFNPNSEFSKQIEQLNRFMDSRFGNVNASTILTWVLVAAAVIFLLITITIIIKYVALTANIRMVDHLENTGEKVTWRKGLRWGWSRTAFRMWLINLVIIIPTVMVILVFFGCAAIPVLLGLAGGEKTTAVGIIGTIGTGFFAIFLAVMVGALINLWIRFARRECVIQNQGVMASIGNGWKTLRKEWKDILVMWLILTGVRIGVGIALIPVVLILLALSATLAGSVGLVLSTIAANMTVTAIIVGIALFLLFLAVPMLFVNGLKETYFESAWTLVYRETQTSTPDQLNGLPEESLPAAA